MLLHHAEAGRCLTPTQKPRDKRAPRHMARTMGNAGRGKARGVGMLPSCACTALSWALAAGKSIWKCYRRCSVGTLTKYLPTYLHSLQTDTGEKRGRGGRGRLHDQFILGPASDVYLGVNLILGQARYWAQLHNRSIFILGGSSSSGRPRQESGRVALSGADDGSSDMGSLDRRDVRRG